MKTETLRALFEYNQRTGVLLWKNCRKSRLNRRAAGSLNGNGYLIAKISGRPYLVHRLIWKIMTGRWPVVTDHKNGVRNDNRWTNLREATRSQNQFNRGKPRRGSLPKGVWFCSTRTSHKKFGARIIINKKTNYLGFFSTPEEASLAYLVAAREKHGEFLCQRQ